MFLVIGVVTLDPEAKSPFLKELWYMYAFKAMLKACYVMKCVTKLRTCNRICYRCGYPMISSGTFDTSTSLSTTNLDCPKYSNNVTVRCYECDSCKWVVNLSPFVLLFFNVTSSCYKLTNAASNAYLYMFYIPCLKYITNRINGLVGHWGKITLKNKRFTHGWYVDQSFSHHRFSQEEKLHSWIAFSMKEEEAEQILQSQGP